MVGSDRLKSSLLRDDDPLFKITQHPLEQLIETAEVTGKKDVGFVDSF